MIGFPAPVPVYPLFDLTHLPVFLSNLPPDLLHELVLFLFLASLLNRPLGSASTDLPDSSTATAPVLLGAGLPKEKARRAAKAVKRSSSLMFQGLRRSCSRDWVLFISVVLAMRTRSVLAGKCASTLYTAHNVLIVN